MPSRTLSGGQTQRMLFARLLLQDARVIVLDEPFNAVDAKTSADLFGLIQRWHGEERTVLTAMHDIDFVRANFPETLLLAREPVAWGSTSTVLTAENLLAARRMCEAFDDQRRHARRRCDDAVSCPAECPGTRAGTGAGAPCRGPWVRIFPGSRPGSSDTHVACVSGRHDETLRSSP